MAISRKGKGRIKATCLATAGETCVVTGNLRLRLGGKTRTIGRVRGSIRAGATGFLRVTLNARGRKALSRSRTRRLRPALKGAVTSAGGTTPLAARPTLLGPKSKK